MDHHSIISDMSKEEFRAKMIRGVARMPEFSKLLSSGIETLSEDEKKRLHNALTDVGVPEGMIKTDEELWDIAVIIGARSVEVM